MILPPAVLVRDGLAGTFAGAALVLLLAEAARHRRYWSERHARLAKWARWLLIVIASIAVAYLVWEAVLVIRDGAGWANIVFLGLAGLWLLERFLNGRAGKWHIALSREADLHLGVDATGLSVPVQGETAVWRARLIPWEQVRCFRITGGLFGYRNGLVEIDTEGGYDTVPLPLKDLSRRDAARSVEVIRVYWPDAEAPPSQQIAARAGDS